MKIERVVLRHILVPLRMTVRTASVERTRSDNVVVEVVTDDGTSGFGEGVPREYVTGETPRTCFDFLRDAVCKIFNAFVGRVCDGPVVADGIKGSIFFAAGELVTQAEHRFSYNPARLIVPQAMNK